MRYEVAIQTFDYPEPHRAKAGDIIEVRPATGAIGKKEQTQFLWITIDVADPAIITGLNDHYRERGMQRRFFIPLARLKSLMSSLDLARVANPNDAYQPFVSINGSRMRAEQDVPLTNLIADKKVSHG